MSTSVLFSFLGLISIFQFHSICASDVDYSNSLYKSLNFIREDYHNQVDVLGEITEEHHNTKHLRDRQRRSVGKFESLKRSEREQRLIESGVFRTEIADDSPSEIRVHVGDRAVLPCRVNHLGTQSVMWNSEGSVISIDTAMLSQEHRYSVSQQDDTWRLTIFSAQSSDAGQYTCSVTSTPPVERIVTLQVLPQGTSLLHQQHLPSITSDDDEAVRSEDRLRANLSAIWQELSFLRHQMQRHHPTADLRGYDVTSVITGDLERIPNEYEDNSLDFDSNQSSESTNQAADAVEDENDFVELGDVTPEWRPLLGRGSSGNYFSHQRSPSYQPLRTVAAHCQAQPNSRVLDSHLSGSIIMTQADGDPFVTFEVSLDGLQVRNQVISPLKLTVHQYLVTGFDCTTVGGVYDPPGQQDTNRPVGDIGELVVSPDGTVHENIIAMAGVSLGQQNNIIGKSIVISAEVDGFRRRRRHGHHRSGRLMRLACCNVQLQ